MSPLRLYRRGLAATAAQVALPYGYTLSIWSSGELVRHYHSPPSVAEIFLFIFGAAAAYAVLRFAGGEIERDTSGVGKGHILRAGGIHVIAIFGGAGVGAALAHVSTPAAWPLASLGATATYLSVVAVEQAFEVGQDTSG